MKRLFHILVMLISSFAPSAQTKLTPLQLNDRLTAITDSLYARGQQWGTAFNEAVSTRDFSQLKTYRLEMTRFISNSITRIDAMKDVNNSKPLRMAMIGFLRFELRMANEAFQPFERFSSSSADEEIEKAGKNLKVLATGEAEELKKVAVAQEKYAEENGFRIESAEEASERKG